jgi:hypothetical protein
MQANRSTKKTVKSVSDTDRHWRIHHIIKGSEWNLPKSKERPRKEVRSEGWQTLATLVDYRVQGRRTCASGGDWRHCLELRI